MDQTRNGSDERVTIRRPDQPESPDQPRIHVTPWILRDPIPWAVKEALMRQAEAQRAAFIRSVFATSFRTLRRLAQLPRPDDR